MDLLVKVLSPSAGIPSRQTPRSAGYDLCASECVTIAPGKRSLVPTGISICLPAGSYGRVAPRSGLSVRGIDVGAGVIDEDYRGEVKVLLINNGSSDFVVSIGDRIAQLLVEPILYPGVRCVTDLEETQRGAGGFGSTGI